MILDLDMDQVGDRICVLLGCDMPVILRRRGEEVESDADAWNLLCLYISLPRVTRWQSNLDLIPTKELFLKTQVAQTNRMIRNNSTFFTGIRDRVRSTMNQGTLYMPTSSDRSK